MAINTDKDAVQPDGPVERYESTYASGIGAIAIGARARAEGKLSIAIGDDTEALYEGSVAIGPGTRSFGTGAVAFGSNTKAQAKGSLAFGDTSIATNAGYNSLVGGYYSETAHSGTIVVGNQLRSANINGAVFGQYNSTEGFNATNRALLILGNGNSTTRSNAFTVDRYGNGVFSGSMTANKLIAKGNYGSVLPASGVEGEIFFLEQS